MMEKEIKWSAPEYHHYEKDISWYWLVAILGIILTAIALWQKNFLFAVFVIIAALLAINWGRRKPEIVDFILSEKGLDIGGKKNYPYESLEGFAIIELPENSELNELVFKTRGRLNAWLKIIIANQRRDAIKEMLGQHVPEIEYQESLADHISKLLRF